MRCIAPRSTSYTYCKHKRQRKPIGDASYTEVTCTYSYMWGTIRTYSQSINSTHDRSRYVT